jgi:hypothetical protein
VTLADLSQLGPGHDPATNAERRAGRHLFVQDRVRPDRRAVAVYGRSRVMQRGSHDISYRYSKIVSNKIDNPARYFPSPVNRNVRASECLRSRRQCLHLHVLRWVQGDAFFRPLVVSDGSVLPSGCRRGHRRRLTTYSNQDQEIHPCGSEVRRRH